MTVDSFGFLGDLLIKKFQPQVPDLKTWFQKGFGPVFGDKVMRASRAEGLHYGLPDLCGMVACPGAGLGRQEQDAHVRNIALTWFDIRNLMNSESRKPGLWLMTLKLRKRSFKNIPSSTCTVRGLFFRFFGGSIIYAPKISLGWESNSLGSNLEETCNTKFPFWNFVPG